jgi:micrococcal nuclease
VTVAPQDRKLFRAARFDLKKLAGKRVRVRGWVELYNGPEMEIATPAAIQRLD